MALIEFSSAVYSVRLQSGSDGGHRAVVLDTTGNLLSSPYDSYTTRNLFCAKQTLPKVDFSSTRRALGLFPTPGPTKPRTINPVEEK